MKKLAVALFLLFPVAAFAQDKIKTIDGKTIEAKILEINDEVVYKEYNYQNGPSYRIKTDEIVSIILENGTVRNFMSIPSEITFPASIDVWRGDVHGDGAEIPEDHLPYILGREGYQTYKSGRTLRRISTPLLIGGGAIAGLGMFSFFGYKAAEEEFGKKSGTAKTLRSATYVLVGIGVPLLVTSIPLRIASKNKFSTVVDEYNHKPHAQLTMGVTNNGLGVQMTF